MPVPNDLSPEDEAAFAAHGVDSAGPGGDPVAAGSAEAPAEQPEPPAEEGVQRDAAGRFAPRQPEPAAQPVEPAQPQPGGDAAQQRPQAPPPGFVPIAALHEARANERQLQQNFRVLQERTNRILQSREEFQLPDIEADPRAYVESMAERLESIHAAQQESAREAAISNFIEQDEQIFASYTPDYEQASMHYINSRVAEIQAMNPGVDARQVILNEANQMATLAAQRNESLAGMIYNLARLRGYQPGGSAQSAAQQQAPAATQQVAALANGQRQRTLSGGAGGGNKSELNAQALLAMSDEEFEAHLGLGKKGADARFQRIN